VVHPGSAKFQITSFSEAICHRAQNRDQFRSVNFQKVVTDALSSQKVRDMHTHLYPPKFGTPVPNRSGKVDTNGLLLWGVDELVTYHYLICEVYRVVPATKLPYEQFWKMSKRQQADHIWKHVFVENTPISEACRGVLTTIKALAWIPMKSRWTPIANSSTSRIPVRTSTR